MVLFAGRLREYEHESSVMQLSGKTRRTQHALSNSDAKVIDQLQAFCFELGTCVVCMAGEKARAARAYSSSRALRLQMQEPTLPVPRSSLQRETSPSLNNCITPFYERWRDTGSLSDVEIEGPES